MSVETASAFSRRMENINKYIAMENNIRDQLSPSDHGDDGMVHEYFRQYLNSHLAYCSEQLNRNRNENRNGNGNNGNGNNNEGAHDEDA